MKESQNTEWKLNWRDEYLRWICGFANAEGGVLVLGRDDKGNAIGVDNSKRLLEDLPNKIRDVLGIIVDVHLVLEAGKELIEVRVEPYPSPISYKGEYHYRSGSTKQELKGAALERFLLRKRGRHWDDVPEPSFTVRGTSTAAFRLFRQQAKRSGRVDPAVLRDSRTAILDNLELVDRHGIKRAACLLFSDRPERFVSGAWIKIGFFVTDDDLRYQDEIRGNLFGQVEATIELLKAKYLKAAIRYEGIHRREDFAFPEAALREALLNAVVHKDYASGIPIQVSVYEDRLVLWNPGELPERWTVANLLRKHASRPFNPLLANAFFRAGYIEAWGRGIEKIACECRAHGIEPPEYDSEMAGLMVTFRGSASHAAALRAQADGSAGTTPIPTQIGPREPRRTTQKQVGTAPIPTREGPATTQERIVELLRNNPAASRSELAVEIGISPDGIKYQLDRLKQAGRIRRQGAARGGTWEVLW
ncbi:MAG: putative DNA binding domain-containing protein [Planctomycetes bacterium]|nr:putative DNA binding domain-containing protein [Planctomycetota bacterium]